MSMYQTFMILTGWQKSECISWVPLLRCGSGTGFGGYLIPPQDRFVFTSSVFHQKQVNISRSLLRKIFDRLVTVVGAEQVSYFDVTPSYVMRPEANRVPLSTFSITNTATSPKTWKLERKCCYRHRWSSFLACRPKNEQLEVGRKISRSSVGVPLKIIGLYSKSDCANGPNHESSGDSARQRW